MNTVFTIVQFFVVTVVLALALNFGNQRLIAYYDGRPHLTFRRQLIQVAGALLVVLFLILLLPFGDILRGQLLSLFGLIVSATIALSSTTLVGNVMAGIMLKTAKQMIQETDDENAVEAAEAEIASLATHKTRIEALIDRKEAKISNT